MHSNWIRTATGVCAAAAIVAGAGIAFAPAANAASSVDDPTVTPNGLVGGVVGTVGGTVGAVTQTVGSTVGGTVGVVTGVVAPTTGTSSPISVTGGGSGGVAVGVGGTTVGIGAGGGSVGVGVTGSGGSGIGVVLGGTPGTTTVGGTVTAPTPPTAPTAPTAPTVPGTTDSGTPSGAPSTGTPSGDGSTSGTPTASGGASAPSTPIVLTALAVSPSLDTVYPSKDGYRDTVAFRLAGTVSDGQQHAANGLATLTFGSSTVATWPVRATNDVITWNGLKGGKVVPGRYVFTARIGDGTTNIAGSTTVVVSPKKLAAATHVLTTKSVSGTHKMAAKPLAGLSKGKVTLRISAKAKGVKGKQYLVFSHGKKRIKVLIRNGKHTSKAVTIPRSFTTYTVSHTWKKGVKITGLKYRYAFKALK